MINEARRIVLSTKLSQMGDSLMKEGDNAGDDNISKAGTLMTLVSTLILFEEDMKTFCLLCDMFSAKKVLDSFTNNEVANVSPEIEAHIQKVTQNLINNSNPDKPKKRKRKKGDDLSGEPPIV